MADDQPDKETAVTPKGAVEVDEKDLDQAAGGVSSGGDLPTESISLNYSKDGGPGATPTSSPTASPLSVSKDGGPGALGPIDVPEKI